MGHASEGRRGFGRFRSSLPFRSADSCDEHRLALASGTHRPRHRLKLRIRQGIHKGDALRCRTCIAAHDSVELHGGMDALLIEVRQRFDCSDAISRTRKWIDDQFKQFSRNGLIRLGGYIPALVDGSLDDAQVLPLFPSLGALCRGSPNPSWRASGLTCYPVFVRRGVFVPVQVEDLLQFQRRLRRGPCNNVDHLVTNKHGVGAMSSRMSDAIRSLNTPERSLHLISTPPWQGVFSRAPTSRLCGWCEWFFSEQIGRGKRGK